MAKRVEMTVAPVELSPACAALAHRPEEFVAVVEALLLVGEEVGVGGGGRGHVVGDAVGWGGDDGVPGALGPEARVGGEDVGGCGAEREDLRVQLADEGVGGDAAGVVGGDEEGGHGGGRGLAGKLVVGGAEECGGVDVLVMWVV